jgi:hypothetical protein
MSRSLARLIPLALAIAATVPVGAAELVDAARAALASSADTVVAVRVVVKVKMNANGQSQDTEDKIEANATVIDPAGLAVTSAAQLDPTAAVKNVLNRMGQGAMVKLESEIKETAVLMADGTEADADIVLTDPDLDLAFIRLRDAKQKLTAAALAKRDVPAKPLDGVFVLGRTDKSANRTATAALGALKCYVKGPQPYYLADAETSTNIGCLVYTADGAPLGLVVSKAAPPADGAGAGPLAMLSMITKPNELMPVRIVRPIDQLAELATQALQAPKPAPAQEQKPAAP